MSMRITGLELFRSALRAIGQLRPGRGPSASETRDGILVFNRMLDALGIDRGNVYTIDISAYPLNAGQQIYTIGGPGAGCDFDAERPRHIDKANLIINTNPASPLWQPLAVWSDEEWGNINLRQMPSTLPQGIYYDGAAVVVTAGHPAIDYLTAKISVWPAELIGGNQLELFTWHTLGQVTDLDAALDMPDGYPEALWSNWARRLAIEWGKPLNPDVLTLARDSLADIQRLNAPHPALACEPLTQQIRTNFNWRTGEIGGRT